MTDLILKIGFIFLWASAFVAAKLGLGDAGPFSMLSIRFAIVAIIFALMVVVFKNSWPQKKEIKHLAIVGVLLHGFYLGGVFYDMFGNYDYAWYLAILLSFVATLLHLPIDEKPIRREATI